MQGAEPTQGEGPSWSESLALFALLYAAWLLLSDHYEPPMLVIGAACCALVVALTPDRVLQLGRFDPAFGLHLRRLRPLALARYGVWLLGQVIQANVHVARVVLHPQLPIDPRLLRFRVGYASRLPQVVLAHSITLTPGTVTIDLQDGTFLVHSLVPASADALASGAMQRGVAEAFAEGPQESAPAVRWMGSVHETGEVVVRDAASARARQTADGPGPVEESP